MKRILNFMILSFLFLGSTVFAEVAQTPDWEIRQMRQQLQQMQDEFQKMQKSYQEMMTQMQEKIDTLEQAKQTANAQQYESEISELNTRINDLENQSKPANLTKILGKLNPDISVIGDFTYHSTDADEGELDNEFTFRELELAFSANVDTYARGDIFLAVEKEDGATEIALEEGYLTLLETPIANLQGKLGKFRPSFGKANLLHLHNMPWTTYPKVLVDNLGEEGFSEEGVSVNYLIPNPMNLYSDITLQAIDNGATIFGGGSTAETVYLGHWKNFLDITDSATIEIGGSHMFGENGSDESSDSQITGSDLTLKWKSAVPGSYQALNSSTEIFFVKQESPLTEDTNGDDFDSFGMYTSLEHQFAQRWSSFGRYDYSEIPGDSIEKANAYSAGVTFAQSEYAFWRVQFTHTENNIAEDINEVWLQLNFGIGPHRAHTY